MSMAYDPDTEERLARFHAESIPLVGGPCHGGRADRAWRPGTDFVAVDHGLGVRATYRVADDGQSAVYTWGSERALTPPVGI